MNEYELIIHFKSETPFYEIGSFIINDLLDKFDNLQAWNFRRKDEVKKMINKEEFEKGSVKENLDFIKKVSSLTTHNAFTKDDLLLLIKAQNEIIDKMQCCENCKHRYYENGINYCNNRCQKNLYNNWELKG